MECARDDSQSRIYRSGLGVSSEIGKSREIIFDPSKLEVVKVLKNGESFEMDIRPDGRTQSTRIRFTHK